MRKGKTKPDLVDVETMARDIGLSKRRVQQLARDGVIPKAQRGRYPQVASIAAYINHLRKRIEDRQANSSFTFQRARLAHEQANKLAFENEERRRVLADAEHIAKDVTMITQRCKARLSRLPHDIAIACERLADAAVIEREAKALVDEALEPLLKFETEVASKGEKNGRTQTTL